MIITQTQSVTLSDIQQAHDRIKGVIRRTPLIRASYQPNPDTNVWLKPESFQPIGSFKLRGAYNCIASLTETERTAGVVAYSSGNHAQGVAYSARELGIKAIIVMPINAPKVKLDATRNLGAEVVLYNPATQKREEVAEQYVKAGMILVPPFNNFHVIAGQGTIGLEIFADLPQVDLVITPVGGGGLISGIATALKNLNPNVKIIGVEPEVAADAYESFKSGKLVEITAAEANRTVADGIRTLSLGPLTFAHIQQYVDDIITVSEDEIRAATRHLILNDKLVIEPSSAVTLAALMAHTDQLPPAKNTVLVLSGGNIDPSLLAELVQSR